MKQQRVPNGSRFTRGMGILGNEHNRWSSRMTPDHKTTLPFTRMLAGPADFTPDGFLNRQLEQFQINAKLIQVQGTRSAEMALSICLESPVINVCHYPSQYRDQPRLDFQQIAPKVWDDTRVLDASVGEHVVIARRQANRWFLGALADSKARDISVKLRFLESGRWHIRLWKDSPDADTIAEQPTTEERVASPANELRLHLARAGGAVAVLERQ